MKIKQFEVAGLAQYSYVVSSGGDAIVIDPMRDFDRYTDYAADQGLTIRYVTETHIHADFASGALALAEATGAELSLSAYDQKPYLYSMEHRSLRDGEALQIGTVRLTALHTPGHTPEHLSFMLSMRNGMRRNRLRSSAETSSLSVRSDVRTYWAKMPSWNLPTTSTAAFMNALPLSPMAFRSIQATVLVRSVERV